MPYGGGRRKELSGSEAMLKKRRPLLASALGLLLVLLFAVTAMADSQLKCKGELPGGYTFTGPEEITVSIDVSNVGDEDMPGPVKLYYPDLTQVEDFGSPTLASGSNRNWEGPWKVTQQELDAGAIEFYVYYPAKDKATGELKNKVKKLSFRISYSGAEPELSISRRILPTMAQKNQEVSVIYEIANTGSAEVSNITIKENTSISVTSGKIERIAPGETGKFVFTAKMGTKDLTSEATVTYKAGGKNHTKTVGPEIIQYSTSEFPATQGTDNYTAMLAKASDFESADELDKAMASYQLAQKLQPDAEEAYLGEARLRIRQAEYDAAQIVVGRILEKNPVSSEAWRIKCELDIVEGNIPAFEADVLYAEVCGADLSDDYMSIGLMYYHANDFEKASEYFLKTDPESFDPSLLD